jgi:hypothetical protein
MRRIFPKKFYNPISLTGAVVVLFNIGLMVFFYILEGLTKHPKPYADIIIFMILPVIILCGLILVVIGIVREKHRQSSGVEEESRLLIIDFNDPRHRIMGFVLGCGFVFLSLLYAFASYNAYEYVESDTFCGKLCHSVMEPEKTAHLFSPHAEVGCVECHVGSGAKYFLLSKFNGSRQLYSLVFNKYERPIPVPIKNLRPAEETCKTCHGPQYVLGEMLKLRTHYLLDTANSKWTINLLLKMGTGRIETDKPLRIHWHATVAKEIRYAATDPKREAIPWIKVTGFDGKERIYRSTETKITDKELDSAEKRVMDCIDCHNRTGHYFRPPAPVLNAYMQNGLIDPSLPQIKKIALDALEKTYASQQAAQDGIKQVIMEFYQKSYPVVVSSKKDSIEQAVTRIQYIHERNYDPVMKASWKKYPDNAGHIYSPGCFRCHDGKHMSSDGKVLSKECSTCHLLISQSVDQLKGEAVFALASYPHPVDIGDSYKEMNCSECHGAGN